MRQPPGRPAGGGRAAVPTPARASARRPALTPATGDPGGAAPERGGRRSPGQARGLVVTALAASSPALIVALLAAAGGFVPWPGPATGLPIGLLLIVIACLAAIAIAWTGEYWTWLRGWLMLLACTVTLLPALAIQTSLSRVPFTSFANGSAGPLIFASCAAIVVLVCLTILAGVLSAEVPEQGSLTLLPALLLVPIVVGTRGDLNEGEILRALALAWLASAVMMAIGAVLPRRARPLIGLAGLGVGIVLAWGLGLGPVTAPGRGLVVPVLSNLILIVAGVCAAAAPIVALAANRFVQTVRSQPAVSRRSPSPAGQQPLAESPPSAPRERR